MSWPLCSRHDSVYLHAMVRGGVAIWWCKLGDHFVASIGKLGDGEHTDHESILNMTVHASNTEADCIADTPNRPSPHRRTAPIGIGTRDASQLPAAKVAGHCPIAPAGRHCVEVVAMTLSVRDCRSVGRCRSSSV